MNTINGVEESEKILLSLSPLALDKILKLFQVESDAWEYTVRYRETGLAEEGLMTRWTDSTEEANKMVTFYRATIEDIQKQTRLATRQCSHTYPTQSYCAWVDCQNCDAEALVELTLEMSDQILENHIQLDDSRCFYRLCIDMVQEFQKKHQDTNWETADFRAEIIHFVDFVKRKLAAYPNWINNDYKWAYGKECVSDLLAKP